MAMGGSSSVVRQQKKKRTWAAMLLVTSVCLGLLLLNGHHHSSEAHAPHDVDVAEAPPQSVVRARGKPAAAASRAPPPRPTARAARLPPPPTEDAEPVAPTRPPRRTSAPRPPNGGSRATHGRPVATRPDKVEEAQQAPSAAGGARRKVRAFTVAPDTDASTDLGMAAADAVREANEQYFARRARDAASVGGLFDGSGTFLEIGDAAEGHEDLARIAYEPANPPRFFASADVQLFVIWGGAMHQASAIIKDVRSRFVVLAVSYFDWPAFGMANASKEFEDNLWRLYSGKGGWQRKGMELKVRQCGLGQFVAMVVLDPLPDYRPEQTAHGTDVVNHNMNAAKKAYRALSGGGFRVHGTFSGAEAQHDIPLLFHRDAADFLRAYRESGGAVASGVISRFLRWAAAAAVPRLLPPSSEATQPLSPRRRASSNVDATAELVRLLHASAATDVVFEEGGSNAQASESSGELAVRYKWKATPREAAPIDALPLGGPAAAVAQRQEAEAEQWLLVPMRTVFDTMGRGGWRTCRHLLLALRTFPVALMRPKQHKDEDDVLVPATFAECRRWPADVEVHVAGRLLWAVAATIGGRPLDGSLTNVADPPTTFLVMIAGSEYKFHMKLTNKRR